MPEMSCVIQCHYMEQLTVTALTLSITLCVYEHVCMCACVHV